MRQRDREKIDKAMEELNRTRKQVQDRMMADSKKREMAIIRANLARYWRKSR